MTTAPNAFRADALIRNLRSTAGTGRRRALPASEAA